MKSKLCKGKLSLLADTYYWSHKDAPFMPSTNFECSLEAGHEGPHRTCGSISLSNTLTEYAIEWGNPQSVVPKDSTESKQA
jgi:hypothetical protein